MPRKKKTTTTTLTKEPVSKGYVWKAKEGAQLFVQRCPHCERENWGPAVASGQCAWCGYVAIESDVRKAS